MNNTLNIKKQFYKYVSHNILGMIGLSCYILADTFFISKAVGADGIATLNLVLPIYNLIFALGYMIGVGSATRYSIAGGRKDAEKNDYFSNALFFAAIFSGIIVIAGNIMPETLIRMLGGDDRVIEVGLGYTRIFMTFAPFFMLNCICNSFVRNDGDPVIAMYATLVSSMFNIVMDYVLMFPCGMGMNGAALATAFSPIVGVMICCIHFFSKRNNVKFVLKRPSVHKFLESCKLGISAFASEFCQGVVMIAFNMIILNFTGNIGVAAYAVVANTALVATAVFNGVAQGSQPLLSRAYGENNKSDMRQIVKYGIVTSVVLAVIIYIFMFVMASSVVAVFNRDGDRQLAEYAVEGIRIYFAGFLFAGVNIVGVSMFCSVEKVKEAFVVSMIRGFVGILIMVAILSYLLGIRGVWLSFGATEMLTTILLFAAFKYKDKKGKIL